MRDIAARTRTGLSRRVAKSTPLDSRISVDLAHLRQLEGAAKSLTFLPHQRANSVLNGRHASRLRGRGLNFEELRNYLPGDDIRSIDWKVTARTGEPHVRVFTEERDRPTLIVVDQRMSMFFGSQLNMKSVTAAETAALAAFGILAQGDRVGGIVFGDEVVAEIRPLASRRAVNAFINALAEANKLLNPDRVLDTPLPLNRPLEAAARIAHNNHLMIVISDFDGIDERTETLLSGVASHNDLILCLVTDPLAHELGDDLNIVASDGDLQISIDARSGAVRERINQFTTKRLDTILEFERKYGIPVLPISAGQPTVPQIRRLLGLPSRK